MVEFENRDVREIRVSKEDFHNWLESNIPDVNPEDNVILYIVRYLYGYI